MKRLLAFARPVAILVAAIVVALVMIKNRPEMVPRAVTVPLPVVDVQSIRLGEVPVTIRAYGNVTASRQLDLTAQVGGRILWKSPAFEPGEIVDEGAVLLRIDRTDYELALAEARQALSSAKLALADATSLRQTARIDEASATVASAEARIARAQRDLRNTEIIAPYRAVIDEQLVELGQFISVGTRLGRILGAERAEIRLPVPPQDIGFIAPDGGTPVALFADDGRGEERWDGVVKRIEARVDAQTRVFPVVAEVPNPLNPQGDGKPLRFGQFVRAEIAGGSVPRAVVLPQAALHGEDDVFVFADGALVRRRVTVARISEGGALVTEGLEEGERVVTTRLDLMFEGMQVALSNDR
jgi:RND family efflux transporter MFP subunit